MNAAFSRLTAAPIWVLLGIVVLPCINWLLTSEINYLLMRPREGETYVGPTRGETLEVIGAAWLANYLPLRPGFFARFAYHLIMNRMPVARTAHALILTIVCGGVAVVTLLFTARMVPESGTLAAAGILLPGLVMFCLARLAAYARGSWANILDSASLRYIDVLVWTGRYALVFYLVGIQLDIRSAVALAAVSQAAMLVPLVGNGLGVREVAIAFVGAALPAWYASQEPLDRSMTIAAEMVNRVGEVAAACVVGGISGWRLNRRMTNTIYSDTPENTTNAGDRT